MEEKIRPLFHITGEKGWINDPNGLIKFNNEYHAFFQYYPDDVHWGPMHWGHVKSKDLLHWENLPIALYPTFEDGCFSGSAIEKDGEMYLLYTSFFKNDDFETIRQKQSLAHSKDGIHFEKDGLVIDEKDLPNGYSPCDFRDPSVWKHLDNYYCLIAAKKKEGRGRILLYKSKDLHKWEFVSDILNEDCKGSMIECPNYSEKLHLLTFSEQNQPNEGHIHLNLHTTRWYSGYIDYESGKFIKLKEGIEDYGFDFYASQMYLDDDLMIGWLDMWDRNNPSEKFNFAGQLSLGRKITMVDNEMKLSPCFKGKELIKGEVDSLLIGKLKCGMISFDIEDLKSFDFEFRKYQEQNTKLTLINDEWVFDRSHSGTKIIGKERDKDSINGIRRMPLVSSLNHHIDIVLDLFSVEIFIDGLSLSSTIYPFIEAEDFILKINSKKCSYKIQEFKK